SQPSLTSFAIVPPAPNSESSGCAVTTRTFSIFSAKGVSVVAGSVRPARREGGLTQARAGSARPLNRSHSLAQPLAQSFATWVRELRRFSRFIRCPASAYRFGVRRVNSYNRVMPIAAPRRVGAAGLLGLLAGALVLMFGPGHPGALRLLGIGLFWWYAAFAAPLVAVLLVAGSQGLALRSGPASHHSTV